MKVIGILLIVVGVIGFIMGASMFGDIDISAMIGASAALFSGIGFLQVNKALTNNKA